MLLAAAAVAFSCEKETSTTEEVIVPEENVEILTINADAVAAEGETKTALSGTTPSWAKDDQVSVVYTKTDASVATQASSKLAAASSTASFSVALTSPDAGEDAYAYYPANELAATSTTAKVVISDEQFPVGTSFDGDSDILVSDAFTPSGTVDAHFRRLGAVLRIKLSNAKINSEKLLNLSVTAANPLAGTVSVRLSDGVATGIESGSNTVTATYASGDQFALNADGKYVYLIVYPQTLASGSSLTFSGETENATFSKTISLSSNIVLSAGHIKPLSVAILDANITPKDKVFVEARFDDNGGTGGNDGNWSGSIASNDISLPNSDWSATNGKGADRCVKFGTGKAGGSLVSEDITIPAVYSYVILHFKAAAWDGTSEGTSLSISSTNSDIKDDLDADVSSVTTVKGAWTTYDYYIKNITGDVAISFSTASGNNRFFLDDVIVYYGASTPKIDPNLAYAETAVAKTYGDASFTNTLTNDYGLTIAYSSSDTDVATVNASTGAVTIVKTGTTRITATFAGDSDYESDSAYYDLTVSKASAGLAYAVDEVAKKIGDANFTNPLTNPHSLTISYASTDEDVATVDSDGEVTIVGGGSTIISASFAGNDYYLADDAIYELTVRRAIKTMSFASSSVDVDKDDTISLPALTIEDSGDNDISGDVSVVYTSSNTSIAEEDSGDILGYAPGHVTLTASITGDPVYEDKSTTLEVYVLGTLPAPTGVTLTTLNKAALAASWTAALGAESYSWELINTSTSAVAKSGTTTDTSLDIDYSADNVPAGTYKLSVVSTLSSSHVGISNSSAGESGTKTVTSSVTISIALDSTLGLSNGVAFASASSTPITLTGAKGSNSNAPKYYTSGDAVRFYGGNTLGVSTATGTIKTIVVTYGSKTNAISNASVGSVGTYDSSAKTQTWTGSATSITLTFGGSSGNDQIKQVSVTYE